MTMVSSYSRVLLVAGMLLSSGCAEWEQHMRDTLPPPQAAYADKQIVVAPTRSVYSVGYTGTETLPSRDEQGTILAFLDRASPSKDSVVLVEQPPRGSERLMRQRSVALTSWLHQNGYQTDVYAAGDLQSGVLRLALDHTMAVVPDCPNWQFHNYFEFGSQPLPNQGCADHTNLAAMVVNPHDLVVGQVPNAPSGHAPLRGEVNYREGTITQPEDAQAAAATTSN